MGLGNSTHPADRPTQQHHHHQYGTHCGGMFPGTGRRGRIIRTMNYWRWVAGRAEPTRVVDFYVLTTRARNCGRLSCAFYFLYLRVAN